MASPEERTEQYAEVRQRLNLQEEISDLVAGEVANYAFGPSADSLDVVCLLAETVNEVVTLLRHQVGTARRDGYTWNAIAGAIGVSRQAATKRFG